MDRSSGCFSKILKLTALLAVLAFIFALPPALFGRDLARVVFQPNTLSELLRSRLLESGLISERLQEAFGSDRWLQVLGDDSAALRPVFQHLSAAERGEVLEQLLPEGWLQGQFDLVLEDFFGWVNSDAAMPEVAIDLQPLKKHLREGGIDSIVEILVDSWPSCTAEGAARLERELLAGERTPSEYCEPSEPMRSELVFLASSSLTDQIDQLPARLPIFQDTDPAQALRIKEQLRTLRAVSLWAWFLHVSLLGVVMALVVRGLDDLRRWWGIPLILSAATAFALVLILNTARSSLAGNFAHGLAGGASIVQSALVAGMEGVISFALRTLLFQTVMLVVLGLLLWFGLRRFGGRTAAWPDESRVMAGDALISQKPGSPPPVAPLGTQDEGEPGDPPSGIFG
jgi:hypothetical protein